MIRIVLAATAIATAISLALFVVLLAIYIYFLPQRGWEKNGTELTALTTALYWEAAVLEPRRGLDAIVWTIFNRVKSKDFPNSIREVVTQGFVPGKKDGCHFSFACDGEIELPYRLCQLHPRDTAILGQYTCGVRWNLYMAYAAWRLYVSAGNDPTNGATHYFVGRQPYWYTDLEESSIQKIGSHTFGRSKWIGRDIVSAN